MVFQKCKSTLASPNLLNKVGSFSVAPASLPSFPTIPGLIELWSCRISWEIPKEVILFLDSALHTLFSLLGKIFLLFSVGLIPSSLFSLKIVRSREFSDPLSLKKTRFICTDLPCCGHSYHRIYQTMLKLLTSSLPARL